MILVIDSGSSKADWHIAESDSTIKSIVTKGLNPYSNNDCLSIINSTLSQLEEFSLNEIHFYGAGIMGEKEKTDFKRYFEASKANRIEINDDLIGAARAVCGDDAGVVAILGTGSNLAYFDGVSITKKIASGGYLLGAEGSGMAIGKEILKRVLRNLLSPDSQQKFYNEYEINQEDLLKEVYTKQPPNAYIASYTKFISQLNATERQSILKRVFQGFVDDRLQHLDISDGTKIHFVGSIAHHFQIELKSVLEQNNFHIGNVIERPIENLVNFHLKRN